MAALAYLRQATFPQLIEPPRFIPRTRVQGGQPEWLTRLLQELGRRVTLAAGFAALVLLAVAALPAWAALQGDGSISLPRTTVVGSSGGATGTSATRVEDFGAMTFVGDVPFVQQLRFQDALAGGGSPASRFVDGARQAGLADYVDSIGLSMTLPYLGDAASAANAFDTWDAAVTAATREAAIRAAAARPAGGSRVTWSAVPLTPGTRLHATVTFYACVGDGFCGNTASGVQVGPGSAACSSNLPFGTRFTVVGDPSGMTFTCNDRGALSSTWVDVWFYSVAEGRAWQSQVGNRADIVIVE